MTAVSRMRERKKGDNFLREKKRDKGRGLYQKSLRSVMARGKKGARAIE